MIGQASRWSSRLTDDVAPTRASKTIDFTRSGKAIARAMASSVARTVERQRVHTTTSQFVSDLAPHRGATGLTVQEQHRVRAVGGSNRRGSRPLAETQSRQRFVPGRRDLGDSERDRYLPSGAVPRATDTRVRLVPHRPVRHRPRRIGQPAGTCWVMQWMLPPPSRISRAATPTTSRSGNRVANRSRAAASVRSSSSGATTRPFAT